MGESLTQKCVKFIIKLAIPPLDAELHLLPAGAGDEPQQGRCALVLIEQVIEPALISAL